MLRQKPHVRFLEAFPVRAVGPGPTRSRMVVSPDAPTSPKTRPPVSGISWACADLVAADNSARATRTGSNSVLHFKTAILYRLGDQ